MLEVSDFYLLVILFIVFIVAVILDVILNQLLGFEEKIINKPICIIGVICLVAILFVNIGNSSTKKYVYTKKYLVTKNFYYEEGKSSDSSDIFRLFENDEPSKKMVFLADGKRYEVYVSDIESRYDFADSKSKKGTTQLIVEIPKIKNSAPDLNKKFFNMSELSNIKVTKTIYK